MIEHQNYLYCLKACSFYIILHIQKSSFSGFFCRLLITFTNSLDPDQDQSSKTNFLKVKFEK